MPRPRYLKVPCKPGTVAWYLLENRENVNDPSRKSYAFSEGP